MLASFAGIAVLLGAIGVYSVAAATAASRRAEFGVRSALGATPAHIASHVVTSSAVSLLCGVVGGTLLSVAGTRALASVLYAPPGSVKNALLAAVALALVALISMLGPAWRAARVDPQNALRDA